MLLLGSNATPPTVAISQVPQLEDGMRVEIVGMLVDIWRYESGAESLVLSEFDGGSSVKVLSSKGIRCQPSQYADIGDELHIIGELSKSGLAPTIFAKSDDISVSRESEQYLTVEVLTNCWELFEGDSIRIGGILDLDGFSSSPRLFSFGMNCSVALITGALDFESFLDDRVEITGVLHFDGRTLTLVLMVSSIIRVS